jgi:uncharacterized RDD family membrane protein YckC
VNGGPRARELLRLSRVNVRDPGEDLLDTSVAIETPEHIVFRYRVAGPARRLLAHVVDLILCYTAVIVVGLVILIAVVGAGAVTDTVEGTVKTGLGLVLVLLFAAQWVYFVAFEATTGRTPGKSAVGLRVVTTSGRPIGFVAAALRAARCAADMLPSAYVVGVVAMAITPRFQRLGDLVAGTMVIVPERAHVARALVLWPPAEPYELATLPDDVTLDADERNAIELFLRRRDALGVARERELAALLVDPLARRFGFRLADPTRMLALLYDRAANAGRMEAPVSSRGPAPWR